MNNLGYFLVGLMSEKLNLKDRLEPVHQQLATAATSAAAPGQERVIASYEISHADQIAAAMAAPDVTQPEPDQFDAILLLAHGTPDVLGEMDAYLKLVTGGRGVPPHVVHELQERYAEIGLKDEPTPEGPHLTRWTLLQGRLLQERIGTPVYVGMRNWKPFISDVVEQMKADGVKKVRAICLAPQNSRTSVGLYRRALETAAAGAFEIDFVAGWSEHTLLVRALAEKMRAALEKARTTDAKTAVLFTAHSVPCRTIQAKPSEHHGMLLTTEADTYAVECKSTARHIAAELEDILEEKDWYFCFQSQGLSGGPWIGPGVEDNLKALKESGYTHAVLQPVGFLCDHVEILYDIDIDFQRTAAEIGIAISRADSLNDSPTLIAALADLARRGVRSLPIHPQVEATAKADLVTVLAPLEEAVAAAV
ncbi:MAG: ferrochelatase [Janthinobacterium lividum]